MAGRIGGGRRQNVRRDNAARRVAAAGTYAFLCWLAANAKALPPADDFLNPQKPGLRLVLMPFIGPGFRTGLDHRLELEEEVTELRTQLLGTVALPFAEVSASVDLRLFLMSFGATIAYHDEWHLLRFEPDPTTGRDRAGQPPSPEPPAASLPPGTRPLTPDRDPAVTFLDLDRVARTLKDQHGDVGHAAWPFYEGRWGFVWPSYGFIGVSALSARYEPRPEVSYDWDVGTVSSGGFNYRWEGYFLFRDRNIGFLGPAARVLYVPRQRVQGNPTIGEFQVVVPAGTACRDDEGIPCRHTYEAEIHYGILGGLRPNWGGNDTLLVRAYATWGLENRLFGTHTFRQPLQILIAYIANLELAGGGS